MKKSTKKSPVKTRLSDEEIIAKYEKWCKDNGYVFTAPSLPLNRTRDYAYLSNCKGDFARFDLRTHRFATDFKESKF
ncbi:MAG: hypothetical protein J6Q22_08050 [Prevotella sp.]|nr:hypothetical protein [Prevotella sp.]